jgi:hypothetical protein
MVNKGARRQHERRATRACVLERQCSTVALGSCPPPAIPLSNQQPTRLTAAPARSFGRGVPSRPTAPPRWRRAAPGREGARRFGCKQGRLQGRQRARGGTGSDHSSPPRPRCPHRAAPLRSHRGLAAPDPLPQAPGQPRRKGDRSPATGAAGQPGAASGAGRGRRVLHPTAPAPPPHFTPGPCLRRPTPRLNPATLARPRRGLAKAALRRASRRSRPSPCRRAREHPLPASGPAGRPQPAQRLYLSHHGPSCSRLPSSAALLARPRGAAGTGRGIALR